MRGLGHGSQDGQLMHIRTHERHDGEVIIVAYRWLGFIINTGRCAGSQYIKSRDTVIKLCNWNSSIGYKTRGIGPRISYENRKSIAYRRLYFYFIARDWRSTVIGGRIPIALSAFCSSRLLIMAPSTTFESVNVNAEIALAGMTVPASSLSVAEYLAVLPSLIILLNFVGSMLIIQSQLYLIWHCPAWPG